jgi:hypothetical protein
MVRKWRKDAVPRPPPAQVVTRILSQFVVQDSPKVRAKFQTFNQKTLKLKFFSIFIYIFSSLDADILLI